MSYLKITAGQRDAESPLDVTLIGQMIDNPEALTPVGCLLAWPLATPPGQFLECDGSAISRTTYADLYAAIGTAYGVGDGSTTFNIPDYRGEFLRGWDHGAARDPDRASRTNRGDGTAGDNVGTKQSEQYISHNHTFPIYGGSSVNGNYNEGGASSSFNTNGSTGSSGGNETRPRNINVMMCIRY